MDMNRDNQQREKSQDGAKDDDEDAEAVSEQQAERTRSCASPSDSLDQARESEKETDTEDDEEDSLHAVSSVKALKPVLPVVTLEGTHITATTTESLESMTPAGRMQKHVNFEEIIEELDVPTPSTSKVVENVREYVKQIENRLEDDENTACYSPRHSISPQPSAAQIIELPKETLALETLKDVSELSFTDMASEESEIERIAHEEVERIVAENLTPSATRERPDFHQVERENQEIAERFKQIMEMFDSFTKNLESLEMPAIKTAEKKAAEKQPQPFRRRLSFKGLQSAGMAADGGGGAGSSSAYNELYLEVHGDRSDNAALAAAKETPTKQNLAQKFFNSSSATGSAQPRQAEAALDPMCRDIATTVSGLELLNEDPPSWPYTTHSRTLTLGAHDAQSLTTIGCQTSSDYFPVQAASSASTSFCNLRSMAKDYSARDDGIVNALIIESINEAPTSSTAAAGTTSFTDPTEISDITVIQPKSKILGTSDQTALVKIREPPATIDLSHDVNAPRVTSVITDATPIDAPCERTYHTIHIEANSTPSSSELRRAPLCSRLWNVITDFCAAVCLCLQVNKDCLFCLGFFLAFVVSASFLTAFFYRTLSINPHLLQVPAAPPHIASHVSSLQNMQSDHPLYGL